MGTPPFPSHSPLQSLYKELSDVWKCLRRASGLLQTWPGPPAHPKLGALGLDSILHPSRRPLLAKWAKAEAVSFPSAVPPCPRRCIGHPLGFPRLLYSLKHQSGQPQMELLDCRQTRALSAHLSLCTLTVCPRALGWLWRQTHFMHLFTIQIPGPHPRARTPASDLCLNNQMLDLKGKSPPRGQCPHVRTGSSAGNSYMQESYGMVLGFTKNKNIEIHQIRYARYTRVCFDKH